MLTWSLHPLHLLDLQNSILLTHLSTTPMCVVQLLWAVVTLHRIEISVQEVTECHATDGAVRGQYSWNNQSIVKKKKTTTDLHTRLCIYLPQTLSLQLWYTSFQEIMQTFTQDPWHIPVTISSGVVPRGTECKQASLVFHAPKQTGSVGMSHYDSIRVVQSPTSLLTTS